MVVCDRCEARGPIQAIVLTKIQGETRQTTLWQDLCGKCTAALEALVQDFIEPLAKANDGKGASRC